MEKNLVMVCLRKLFPRGVMKPSWKRRPQGIRQKFDIQRRIGPHRALLSGGNQQKVVIGKWLAAKPRVIIIDEPPAVLTWARIGSAFLMDQLANSGHAILMISSEMPEILV
jgi:ABC-type sugar transport system ATPase subunit